MSSPDALPDLSGGPLAPAVRLAHAAIGACEHVALGWVLGVLLARLMRRSPLHWSWALVALACVLVLRALFAGAITTVPAVALLIAAGRGARHHGRDLMDGADLGRAARARVSPFQALGRRLSSAQSRRGRFTLAARLPWRRIGAPADGWWPVADRLTVGEDARGRPVAIPLGGIHGGTHTLVLGASGSGKTVTQAWIAVRAIEHGMGAVVVDPKDDRDLRAALRDTARRVGRRFVEWTPQGPWIYNPYGRGGDTEIADKLLAAERFTEPHYLRQAQRYLGHEVRALRAAGAHSSLAALVRYLEPRELRVLARELEPEQTLPLRAYLDSLSARQLADLTGVRDRLAIIAESDIGRWLEPQAHGPPSFDLLEILREGAVAYFSLESDRRPLLTQMLGSAIVQDLQTTVAAMQGAPVASLAVIDEFSAVAAEQVARLFGRARAAGMSLLLGTQELSDLRLPGRELLLEQVLGNVSSVIAHRQVVPASADLIAQLAGTAGSWKTSWAHDGRFTRTRVREPLLRAEELAGLARGRAAVITLSEGTNVRLAQIHSISARG